VRRARELLRKSLELEPDCAEALAGLGRSFLYGEAPVDEGLETLTRAHAIRPYCVAVVHDLACALASTGRTEPAWSLIERKLRPRAEDPGLLLGAERRVAAAHVEAVNRQLETGDLEGAKALLRDALEHAEEPEVRLQLETMLARLERAVDGAEFVEAARAEEYNRFVETYNEASRLAGKGSSTEALETLDGLLEACDESRACDRLREAIGSLRNLVLQEIWIGRYNEAVELLNAGCREEGITILVEVRDGASGTPIAESAAELLRRLDVER
jgi:tetratricopeptide (TPR) repeat protein